MTEVIFAQLCKTVSSIEQSDSLILNLYEDKEGNSREISAQDFINLFYSKTENGDFKFNMNLDASSSAVCKKYLDLSSNWFEKYNSVEFQVAERIPEEYANMMGITAECFDTCSLMKLRGELLELEDLCEVVCNDRQVICCSLSLEDLVETLRDGDNNLSITRSESTARIDFEDALSPGDTIIVNINGQPPITFTATNNPAHIGGANSPNFYIGVTPSALETRNHFGDALDNYPSSSAGAAGVDGLDFSTSSIAAVGASPAKERIDFTTKSTVNSPESYNGSTFVVSNAGVVGGVGTSTFSGGVDEFIRKNPKDLTITQKKNTDGSTYIGEDESKQMLKKGDKLAFSILVTNPSNKVKDVELLLHFKID